MTSHVITRRAALAAGAGAALSSAIGARAHAQGAQPIKIGFSIAQTGTLAAGGKAALLARLMWRDDVNSKGGVLGRPVEIVYYDDQTSPATTPGIYAKLLDVDKVDILYGPYGTPVQAPVLPLAKQRGLIMFGNFNFRANEELKYDGYFNIAPFGATPDAWPGSFVQLANRNGLKKLAIMAADSEGTLTLAAGAREVAGRLGMEIVYDQKYPFNTVDFSPILRAVRAARPEAVYVGSFPNESAAVIRAIDEVGLGSGVKLFGGGMVGLQYAALLESLGPALNGVVNFQTYVPEPTMNFPGVAGFLDRYAAKAKEAGVDTLGFYLAPFNYAMGQVVQQAVEATKGTDNRALAKYMHEAEFDTLVGKLRFGPTGEWATPRMVQVQFQGVKGNDVDQFRKPGREVIIEPPELKSGDLVPFDKAR